MILAWIAFVCWVFYYSMLVVGCIILTYLIKWLEAGAGSGGAEVLDDIGNEEMGVRRWRYKMWAWWDQVTMLYVGS